ncbi:MULTISPECIES: YggT family protein [Parachlamydia]|uniref:Uncharacterized membrane protein ylmG n=1 Tax=Parachlamydia acanthamoebae (strain UV7) TaxID=765952 RepID=F8KV18_PARAV|nr:YggT family protein [Parachlamydia acanthamoebae]EFB41217.1 hypothetical protein pah_c048o038 [Parachlamydia acanthamoebae str. Hall's coccus]CCB85089.1 uncharacterized membrane protein ylmG [Parachlamydia acanthamoebae UV-7]
MILVNIISLIFQVYFLMLFARILSSWLPELHQYRIMQFIAFYTDPYLNFFRGVIPPLGMIDISPIFAFLALSFIEYFLKILLINL